MRLFAAAWPPPPVVEQLAGLDRPDRDGLRWTTADQWHVTLRFFGEVPDPGAVKDALEPLRGSRGALASLGPRTVRLGPSILCAPVAGLEELVTTGHITLARAKRGVDLRPLAGAAVSATWTVAEITLVSSTLHPQGARYEIVARYPLAVRPERTSPGSAATHQARRP